MEYRKDQLVRHPKLGLGKVLKVAGDKVTVFFKDEATNPKMISTTSFPLVLAESQADPWLDHLDVTITHSGEVKQYLTQKGAIERFLHIFPLGFYDPKYIGDAKTGERFYKWQAHERWKEMLSKPEFERLLNAADHTEVVGRAMQVESKTNLLATFEKAALRDAVKGNEAANAFSAGLFDLIYGQDPFQARFVRFADMLDGLPQPKSAVDLEFLMRVAQKVETIREDLGTYGTVLADDVEQAMLGQGYSLGSTSKAETKAEPVRKMLKFERDLAKQIKQLLKQYQETQRELRLSPDNIRKVVQVALQLADQPTLIPSQDHADKPVFVLPALKGTWAACAEGLEHPHTKEIRPITFDHAVAYGRDDVVLAHLNHRLVQMSLRLLRAEVWSVKGRKRLHRITTRLVPNHVLNTPAVMAHARLVVIGGDSYRLHEEIITAGGLITEGRFARKSVNEVEKLFAEAGNDETYEPMQERLLAMWERIAPPLAQSLEARMKDRTSGLQKKLAERADKEADDIRAILTELKKAIETELDDPEYEQLSLFDDPEKEQFERNRDFLRARAKAIPEEIKRETEAIRSRYANPQPRMFPVAVTFLVPERMQ